MAEKRGYGVGLRSFPEMIKRECVYVDKTAYVYKMAQSKGSRTIESYNVVNVKS